MSVLITIFLTTIDIYIVHCANRHSQWRLSFNFIISVVSLKNRIGLDDLFGDSKFASKNGAKQLYYRSDIRKSASHWHMIDGRQTLCPNYIGTDCGGGFDLENKCFFFKKCFFFFVSCLAFLQFCSIFKSILHVFEFFLCANRLSKLLIDRSKLMFIWCCSRRKCHSSHEKLQCNDFIPKRCVKIK